MTGDKTNQYVVAVIGAGPAGIYAARQLASAGARVALINRDIKPGGLAEYGIYYDKYKMKDGLRKQFRQILTTPEIQYFGNVTVGSDGDLTLDELRKMGFQAVMVTVGAQGTKWLGLPGEEYSGVYHAKDLVYHYNKLPPFSTQNFRVRGRVALIGVGNVMMDIAHWVIRDVKVDEAIAVARRGPAEVKFSKKEMEAVGANLDLVDLDKELERCRPLLEEVDQDVSAARDFILAGLPKALESVSQTRFRFDFLASPTQIFADAQGNVCGLEVEDTKLALKNGDTKARSLGTRRILDVETVIFCIGDRVDETFGLPVQWNEFVKNPQPIYPVAGLSYEAYDPDTQKPIEGVFVAGWSREASSGLVGLARKDGENGAQAMLQYLQTRSDTADAAATMQRLEAALQKAASKVARKDHITRLEAYEQAQAEQRNLEEYKLKTNEEMLQVMGL